MLLQFFVEGGWGMWPVLVFGLVMLASAGRYAWDLEPARLRFVVATAAIVIVAMSHAMLSNVAAVLWYVSDPERAPDTELTRTVFTGLMESTRPGLLGGALLLVALVLVAVGVYRGGVRELRASAG
ncbi:MAG: hypothetical protein M3Y87_34040 [Myxococcota bacterium]|nr:hypothetical protein [Myxococcota bacterium]